MTIRICSPAFANDAAIPDKFAKDGGNASPPFEWNGAPEGTRSFALVVEDPDTPSGTFRHWAIYDRLPTGTALAKTRTFRASDAT